MKRTILITALVIAVLAVLAIGVGVVFAQNTPAVNMRHTSMMNGSMPNGEGPLHIFMVTEFAKQLDLNVNDVNTRLAAGESMYDIALSAGVTAEEFPAVMTEVRAAALDAAVAANVITQEQADWMKTRGSGQGGMMNGDGTCDGTGQQHGGMHSNRMGGWQNQQVNP